MATVTRSRPRVKPARSCRLMAVDGGRFLSILMGSPPSQTETHYHLSEIAVDYGRGFALRKLSCDGGDVYHVHLDAAAGSTCDCLGYLRWSKCKHRDALAELVRRGMV